jgi:chromate reductase
MQLLAICASARPASINAAVLRCARSLAAGLSTNIVTFDHLHAVPACDGADDGGGPHVAQLRSLVSGADAVLIVTPEYGHSMPGVLKNALDWLVMSGELALRPVAVIAASSTPTAGMRAISALIHTLLAQSAVIVALLGIPNAKVKLDSEGELAHAPTRQRIGEVLRALADHHRERLG